MTPHDTIVRLLIEAGADTTAKDNFGRTPLLQAALLGHEAVVWLLIETGYSDVNVVDKNGKTAFILAIE